MTILPVRTERLEGHAAQAVFFMTRPVKGVFRLAADTGRSGAEGGMAASTLLKRPT